MSPTDDILKEFLVESYENLDRLDQDLLRLEKAAHGGGAADRDTLSSVFRTIHTIKGTCGFLGLGKLEAVSHVGENLLSRLRDGELPITPPIISGLLELVDAVRKILANVEATGSDGDGDHAPLIALLTRLKDGTAAPAPAAAAPALAPVATAEPEPVPEPVAAAPVTSAALAAEAPVEAPPAAAAPAAPAADHEHDHEQGASAPGVSDSTIRVDVSLLDKLMNLVGELVLARNQVLQFAAGGNAAANAAGLLATSQRLNLVTTELQEGVMKTRMQPIGNVWGKFPRIVRDLAVTCGKRIRVEMEGKETELDKTIIEAIKDPLTHIVRNSADHGIEPPDARAAKGKPPEGRLFLRAFHEGGQVNIEISDDGGGINVERVKAKALKQGLITAEQAGRMGEREAVNLIFLPGFSTAEKVTNVSGRGVGMDVVKTNIERIGGTVDVQTVLGAGTTLRIKIPLTLAIIPALIVTAGGDRYAIPQVSLVELVRLEGNGVRDGVELVHGAPVHRLRGRLLPLVHLGAALELAPADPAVLRQAESLNVVVLQADDRQFGLVVDEINDTEEIVVKPLSKQLKRVVAFAGATIMGDGRVALILDAMGIAQRANLTAAHAAGDADAADAAAAAGKTAADRQALLLLSVAGRRVAVPLAAVARLEEFRADQVEQTGLADVVQYRGQVMPVVRVAGLLTDRRRGGARDTAGEIAGQTNLQAVVVNAAGGRCVGLVVDRILDIVEEAVAVQRTAGGPGVLGTAVIQNRVTELLDVPGLIAACDPGDTPRALAA